MDNNQPSTPQPKNPMLEYSGGFIMKVGEENYMILHNIVGSIDGCDATMELKRWCEGKERGREQASP